MSMQRILALGALLLLAVPRTLWAHPGAEAALAYFSAQINAHPQEQSLYIERGITYSNDGQYAAAQADFARAEKLGEPVIVAFQQGVLHYRTGDFNAARQSFDWFLRTFPDHTACLEYRARLLRDAGDYPAAVADFKRVFELQPRPNPGDYISVAGMLGSAGPEGVAQALAIIDEGNSRLGLTPQLQEYAVKLELARGRPDGAAARLRTLEPMLGASPDWKVDMAELEQKAGRPDQAAALLDDAATQLETLRKTPARLELQKRAQGLRASLDA